MNRIIFIITFMALNNYGFCQKSSDYIFGWNPINPSEWLRENAINLFTTNEIELLNNNELYFRALVNIKGQRITSFKLDTLDVSNLDAKLIKKLEVILLENIGISKITNLSYKALPEQDQEYYLPIILKNMED